MFLSYISLLIPAFFPLLRPRSLTLALLPRNLFLYQSVLLQYIFHSFGGMFQPRTFSAHLLSTSELLRTLLMNGCF